MWSDVIFVTPRPSYLPKEWWADNKQHDTFYDQAHCQEGESQEAQALSLTSGFRSFFPEKILSLTLTYSAIL
jgi:hypothetical protein